jgi:hypothetical protein
MAYLAVLALEHAHNHPVVRVFCELLISRPWTMTSVSDTNDTEASTENLKLGPEKEGKNP